jgi:leader peptidase (prepilin peptidase)/N-methyltransferase
MILGIGLLLGAFIGSFLNVCIHRMPRNESIVMPPSRCYSCGTQVQWYDNLPVLGWLILGGRCRWCGAPFSPRYLIMELLVAALTALVLVWSFQPGLHIAPWLATLGVPLVVGHALLAAALLVLVYVLFVSSVIDIDHMLIPDELTKGFQVLAPAIAVAVGTQLVYDDVWTPAAWLWHDSVLGGRAYTPAVFLTRMLGGGAVLTAALLLSLPLARAIYGRWLPVGARWSDEDHRGFAIGVKWFSGVMAAYLALLGVLVLWRPGAEAGWWAELAAHLARALTGAATGWLVPYGVGLLGTVAFRRNAMGYGDVKFLAPIGAFLGPAGVLYAFFAAAVIGSVVGLPLRLLKQRIEIPFGPYLAAGALVVVFFGAPLHHQLFGALLRQPGGW